MGLHGKNSYSTRFSQDVWCKIVDLVTLLIYSSALAILSVAVAYVVYTYLKNSNIENASMFAAIAGISTPLSVIALLLLKYLQFLTSYFGLIGQVP